MTNRGPGDKTQKQTRKDKKGQPLSLRSFPCLYSPVGNQTKRCTELGSYSAICMDTFPCRQPHLPPSHPLSMPLRASESPPTLSQTCHTLHAPKPSCTCIISGKTPLHILRVSCPPAQPSTPSPFWPRQSLTLSSGALRPMVKSPTECVSHACGQLGPSPEGAQPSFANEL